MKPLEPTRHPLRPLLVAVALAIPAMASAAPLTVTDYTMVNGRTGTYNYRDFTYNPCNGVCDVSAFDLTGPVLSGGTGKLTDGVSPGLSWDQYGQPGALTPWVGWVNFDPTITFNFGSQVHIDSITLWVDNTPPWGDVRNPDSVVVQGVTHQISPDSVWGPRGYTFGGLNLDTSSVTVTLNRDAGRWIMLGEVSFDGGVAVTPVPEPETYAMLLAGLGLLGVTARRRRAR